MSHEEIDNLVGGGLAKYIGPKNEGLSFGKTVEIVSSVYKIKREKFVEVVYEGFRYFNVKPWMLK